MLLPPLLATCLAQAVVRDAPVDRLIENSDWIGVARVEALHPLKGTALQLVELSAEDSMLGPPGEKAFAFPNSKSSRKANELELGQTYLLFLEQWRVPPFAKPQAIAAETLTRGAPVYRWIAFWKVEGDRVTVPPGALPPTDGPTGLAAGAKGNEAPRKELHDWLDHRIGVSLPCIRVTLSGTGPAGPLAGFTIGPDGSVRGWGASSTSLDRARLQELWDGVLHERFDELPERVGAAADVCAPTGSIEVRRREGSKKVYISGPAIDRVPAAERDAAERALRIWRALPIADPTFGERKK